MSGDEVAERAADAYVYGLWNREHFERIVAKALSFGSREYPSAILAVPFAHEIDAARKAV